MSRVRAFIRDERGQSTVEYLLLTAVVAIPLAVLTPTLLTLTTNFYYRIAGSVSLPLP